MDEQQDLMRPLRLTPQTSTNLALAALDSRRAGRAGLDGCSDTELLQATGTGDAAFTIFYRRNIETILTFFWQRTRDHEVTADLASETFAVALENIDKFDPARGDGAQWLHGIASNLLKGFWRRNKVSNRARRKLEVDAVHLKDEAAQELQAVEAQLDGDQIKLALQQLPAKNRQAVHLRLVEDLSYDEIAEQLGCKPGAARVRVLRGLRRLQNEFNQSPTRDGAS